MSETLGVALLFGCFISVHDGVPALKNTGLVWLLCLLVYVSVCWGCGQSREGKLGCCALSLKMAYSNTF
jgi:hypothetical protein